MIDDNGDDSDEDGGNDNIRHCNYQPKPFIPNLLHSQYFIRISKIKYSRHQHCLFTGNLVDIINYFSDKTFLQNFSLIIPLTFLFLFFFPPTFSFPNFLFPLFCQLQKNRKKKRFFFFEFSRLKNGYYSESYPFFFYIFSFFVISFFFFLFEQKQSQN